MKASNQAGDLRYEKNLSLAPLFAFTGTACFCLEVRKAALCDHYPYMTAGGDDGKATDKTKVLIFKRYQDLGSNETN